MPAIAAVVLLLSCPWALAQEAWWNYDWSSRRAVTISDVPQSKLPGDEVGVVTMPTGGLTAADARDVRVTTAAGDLVPHRLLMAGPGDQLRLAFALRSPITKYFVYFGNDKAAKPADILVVKRGVLLETWTFAGGPAGNFRQVQAVFDRAGELIGRDFRRQIFQGHNPFGPQDRIASLYTAFLICPDDGEYTFATSSQDASFLTVDGQAVVDNGGFHPPQRQASRQGKLKLTKGLHELKVYHVTGGLTDPVITAAWQEPNARRLWTIPPEAFAPIRVGTAGILERYGKAVQADFIPVHAGETFMASRYYQRYSFELLSAGKASAKPAAKWDFGDGQTATAPKVDHVFLRFGPFKVTMTAQLGGETITRTNSIFVARPWEQVTENKLEPLSDYARLVAGYDFAGADPRDVGQALALFQRAGLPEAIIKAGDLLVKRDAVPPAVLREGVPIYAAALVSSAKDSARAVAALAKAADMAGKDPAAACFLSVSAGRVALEAGDTDRALALFEQALKKFSAVTTDESLRDARIGIGDAFFQRGDYDQALAGYRSARPQAQGEQSRQAIRQGDLARHVEDYIRQRLYADAADALDRWAQEFPADKLEGFWTLHRARLALAQKDYALAARLVEQLVKVNPRSNYAAELLALAGDAYRASARPDLARSALERIVKDYPESPLAQDARKRLGLATTKP